MKNPYAFPFVDPHTGDVLSEGMTLRDYFAAKAMQAYIRTNADAERTNTEASDYMLNQVVSASYKTADFMIKARKQ